MIVEPHIAKVLVSQLLDQGLVTIQVFFTKGVVVPNFLKSRRIFALNLSWRFEGPPMVLSDEGISAQLSFNKEPFDCFIPWDAIISVRQKEVAYAFATDKIAIPIHWPASESRQKIQELEVIEGGQELSPPKSGHLKLVH